MWRRRSETQSASAITCSEEDLLLATQVVRLWNENIEIYKVGIEGNLNNVHVEAQLKERHGELDVGAGGSESESDSSSKVLIEGQPEFVDISSGGQRMRT